MKAILAGSVEEALRRLENSAVDIIITDLILPPSSGLDLLKQVHEMYPGVAVLMLTQYGTIDSAVAATRMGAVDYVTKPFHIEDLRARLERVARVLVVEDEPTVARLIADVLEDEGLHVDVLLDGREGLERAGRETFDLVVCDMKMPGVDGQHFFKSLGRARNPLQEKFLFVTGDVIAQQTQEFLERNSLPHVAKPFRVEELTEKVFSLLDNQLARRGRAAAAKKTH
jgi:DNA-binding response OmpR family regulator